MHNGSRIDTFQTPQGFGGFSERDRGKTLSESEGYKRPCMLPLQGGYALLGKWDVIRDLHAELRAEMAALRQDVANSLKLHRDELEVSFSERKEGMRGVILEEVQSLRQIFPDALGAIRNCQREAVDEIRADLNAGVDLLRQEVCQSFNRLLQQSDETRAQERVEVLEELRKTTKELAGEVQDIDVRKKDMEEVLSAFTPLMTQVLSIENSQAEIKDVLQAQFDGRWGMGESIDELQLHVNTAFSRIEAKQHDVAGLVLNAIGDRDLNVNTCLDNISAEIGTLRGSHALHLSDLLEEVRRGKTEMVQEIRLADLHSRQAHAYKLGCKTDAEAAAEETGTCVAISQEVTSPSCTDVEE
jgi:hypothetical protein